MATAIAFKRDVPNAVVKFSDIGHFALETTLEDIASAILEMPMPRCGPSKACGCFGGITRS